jgi:hypothetical protein
LFRVTEIQNIAVFKTYLPKYRRFGSVPRIYS